eukprot:1158753-Pelagomonas_calceolata.AAC.6
MKSHLRHGKWFTKLVQVHGAQQRIFVLESPQLCLVDADVSGPNGEKWMNKRRALVVASITRILRHHKFPPENLFSKHFKNKQRAPNVAEHHQNSVPRISTQLLVLLKIAPTASYSFPALAYWIIHQALHEKSAPSCHGPGPQVYSLCFFIFALTSGQQEQQGSQASDYQTAGDRTSPGIPWGSYDAVPTSSHHEQQSKNDESAVSVKCSTHLQSSRAAMKPCCW